MISSEATVEQGLMADPVHHDAGTVPGEGMREWRTFLAACIRHEASDLHLIGRVGGAERLSRSRASRYARASVSGRIRGEGKP